MLQSYGIEQVAAPAWIVQTAQLPAADSNCTQLAFTMSGVPLPGVDQITLR